MVGQNKRFPFKIKINEFIAKEIMLKVMISYQSQANITSGKKVAQNSSEFGNIARLRFLFNNHADGASMLLRINVFNATFLPDFDS